MGFFERKLDRRGVITLEYVILITGVISVLVLFLQPSGLFSSAMNATYQSTANSMVDMGLRLARSRDPVIPVAGSSTRGLFPPSSVGGGGGGIMIGGGSIP